MFELSIGAMLARQGFNPVFSECNPDIEFQFANRRILIECKRILSHPRTQDAIDSGVRQLRKQVNCSKGDVALVAVNISREFYRGDGYWNAQANADVHEILSNWIADFIEGERKWLLQRCHLPARAVFFYGAVLFRIDGVGYIMRRAGTLCRFDLKSDGLLAQLASKLQL